LNSYVVFFKYLQINMTVRKSTHAKIYVLCIRIFIYGIPVYSTYTRLLILLSIFLPYYNLVTTFHLFKFSFLSVELTFSLMSAFLTDKDSLWH
jgi:hypothetical protein